MSLGNDIILLIEDNCDDVFLMKRALRKAHIENSLHVVQDGRQALDYLAGSGTFSDRIEHPFPAFIFIDLMLPYVCGWTVLEWLRNNSPGKPPYAFILTSSNEPTDVEKARSLGADSYLVKPPTAEALLKLAKTFNFHWFTPSDTSPKTPTLITP